MFAKCFRVSAQHYGDKMRRKYLLLIGQHCFNGTVDLDYGHFYGDDFGQGDEHVKAAARSKLNSESCEGRFGKLVDEESGLQVETYECFPFFLFEDGAVDEGLQTMPTIDMLVSIGKACKLTATDEKAAVEKALTLIREKPVGPGMKFVLKDHLCNEVVSFSTN